MPSRKDPPINPNSLVIVPTQAPRTTTPTRRPSTGGGLVINPTSSPSRGGSSPSVPTSKLDPVAQTEQERESTVGGWGSIIPVVYGKTRIGGTVVFAQVMSGNLHVVCSWGMGRCKGPDRILIGEKDITELKGVLTSSTYFGTTTQVYPAALNALAPGYVDNLTSICYTYFVFSGTTFDGGEILTTLKADFSGRYLYDPRVGTHNLSYPETWAYSENPVLALADWVWRDDGEGQGSSALNWDSVKYCADRCDDIVGGKRRYTIGLALREMQEVFDWREVLRAYAHVITYQDKGKLVMIPDAARSTSVYFTADNVIPKTITVQTRKEADIPNAVEVVFTDADHDYRQDSVKVGTGDESRTAIVRMPGIIDRSEAAREARLRINRYTLEDRDIRFDCRSIGAVLVPGDVVSVDFPNIPITGLFQIGSVTKSGPDRWTVAATAYSSAIYTNVVASPPVYTSTTRPDPYKPPRPVGITVVQQDELLNSGVYNSYWVVTWDDMNVDWPFVYGYEVQVIEGNTVRYSTIVDTPAAATGSVKEGTTYTISIRTLSRIDPLIKSEAQAVSRKVLPVSVPPPNVAQFTRAQEMGGTVYLWWTPVAGAIRGYHLKYGDVNSTWENATDIDPEHKSTSWKDNNFLTGSYRFFVKAVGPTGKESLQALSVVVQVVQDVGLQFLGNHAWELNELVLDGFRAYEHDGQIWAFTDNSEAHTFGYTGATWDSDGMDQLPWMLPRNEYGSTGTVVLETASWEITDHKVGGQFSLSGIEVTKIEEGDNADYLVEIGISETDVDQDFFWQTGMNVTGSGRYVRVRITDLSDGPLAGLLIALNLRIEVLAIPRSEPHILVISGPQPIHLDFDNSYSAFRKINATSLTAGAFVSIDNLTSSGCDIYLTVAATGNPTDGTVSIDIEGV